MIPLPHNAEIFLYSHPTDMRKSFCGLSGIVRSELGREPSDGSLFLFINRRKDRLKALYWDADGMILFYKLLQSGTFERVASGNRPAVKIDAAELGMLLSGIDIQSARRRRRSQKVGETEYPQNPFGESVQSATPRAGGAAEKPDLFSEKPAGWDCAIRRH